MKKIFSLAVALIASVSMFAQSEVGSVNITPKVGINIANVTSDAGQKSKVGIVAGAEVAYQTSAKCAISAGALYSAQGYKVGDDGKANLNYLNIPVLANYYVAKGLAIKAGIQPSILLSAKVGGEDWKEFLKKVDFSIPVGISYEVSNVVIDARYNAGVTQILKEGEGKAKHSVFQFTLGYKF